MFKFLNFSGNESKKSYFAFTLAEVLITLGIIGIVAAMTMPILIGKYTTKVRVTALKKSYSVLSQALLRAVADYGDPAGWSFSDYVYEDEKGDTQSRHYMDLDIITKYMTFAQDCGHEAKGCFGQKYEKLNGSKERDFEKLPYYRKIVTSDGTAIAMHGYGSEPAGRGEIWVDVNGKKAPNVVGEDMFLFYVKDANIYPYGAQATGSFEQQTKNCNRKDVGYTCALWVLTNENQDYL